MSKETRQKRVGELQLEALADPTPYDVVDVTNEAIKGLEKALWECVDRHKPLIDEPMFCVVSLLADDILLRGIIRRKIFAWPFLPKVRANQCVWLYRKACDTLELLWTFPEPHVMAMLAADSCPPIGRVGRVKYWVDHFYKGDFHDRIRADNNITLETEEEFSRNNAQELEKSAFDGHEALGTNVTHRFEVAAAVGLQ